MRKSNTHKPTKRPEEKFVATAGGVSAWHRALFATLLRISGEYYSFASNCCRGRDAEETVKHLASLFAVDPHRMKRCLILFHYYRTAPDEICMIFEECFLCTMSPALLEAFIPYLHAHFKGPRTGIGPQIHVTPVSIEVRRRCKGGQFMWFNLATLSVEDVRGLRGHIMTDDERMSRYNARRSTAILSLSSKSSGRKSPKEIELDLFLENTIRDGVPIPI